MLVGRDRERHVLDELLETARTGRGAVLVLRGEPGIGKPPLTPQELRIARLVDLSVGWNPIRHIDVERS